MNLPGCCYLPWNRRHRIHKTPNVFQILQGIQFPAHPKLRKKLMNFSGREVQIKKFIYIILIIYYMYTHKKLGLKETF